MKRQIIYLLFVLFAFTWHSEAQVTSFPWSEDFEGTFLPSGWAKEIPDASNDITQSNSQNHTAGGQYSARFSSYNTSNDYNQYLFSEQIHVTAPYTQLTFWHRKATADNELLEWGISTTGQSSADVATWTAVTLSDSDWQQEIIDLSGYVGQDIYISWHYFGNYLYYVYMDDVMIDQPPACAAPSGLTASNITTSQAELSWTENGNATVWNIELGVNGFTPTGTPTNSGVTNPFTVTGLSSNTTYDYYVQADCGASGGTGTSSWSGPYTFSTLCATQPLPYSNDFDTNADCWTLEDTNGDSVRWHLASYNNISCSADNSDGVLTISYNGTMDMDDWVFSPGFDLTAGTSYTLSFSYGNDGGTTYTEDMDVYISTGANSTDALAGTQIMTETGIINGCHDYNNNNITVASTGTYYIAFHGKSPADQDVLMIDDFSFMETPACPAPTDLSASNITDTTADLSWNGSANIYNIEIVTNGTQPTGTPTATGVTSPYTANSLTPNTPYDYYVQADCGGGSTSTWAGPYTFYTLCEAVSAFPYDYDFEDTTSNNNANWDGLCWSANPNNTTGYYRWNPNNDGTPSSSTGPSGAHSGTQYAFTEASGYSTGDIAELFSPMFDMSGLSQPQLTFYYHMFGSDMGTLHVDTYDGTNWTNDVWSLTGQQQTSDTAPWQQATVNIPNTVTQIRFRAERGSGYTSDMAVDDIKISEAPTCPAPTALDATNITTSQAVLGWTAGGSENAWNIEYGVTGFTQGQGTTIAGVTNPYTLTGLSESTTYDYYVQADCGGGDVSVWSGPFTFITTPANNDCSSAILLHIGCGSNVVEGSNVGATDSGVDAPSCGNYQGGDVWFQVEVPQTGALLIDTHAGGITDGAMSVYTGSCGNLVEVDCNDDGGTGLMPQLNLTGLTPGSMIYIRFWEYGNNSFGTFTIDVSESGTCQGTITPDYTQTFNNYLPGCWEEGKGSPASMYIHNSDWVCDGFGNIGTSGAARITMGALNKDEWLITPSFDLSAGNYELSFKVGVSHMSQNIPWTIGKDETVELMVSTDGGATWSGTSQGWGYNNSPSLAGDFVVVNLDNYTQTDVKFAFYMHSGNIYDGFRNFYVDDFIIKSVGCFAPTDLYVNTMQPVGSVEFSWTDNNSGNTDYTLYWGEVGTGLPNSVTVSGTSYQLDNLMLGVDYEWAVMADCDSDLVFGANFNLGCSYYVPDYLQEFNDYLPTCWEEAKGTQTALSYQNSLWTSDGFGNVGTTGAARIMIGTLNKDEWLISPSFDLSAAAYELTFDVALSHMSQNLAWSFGADEYVQLMVSTDGGSTWNDIVTWDQNNTPSLAGDYHAIDLSPYQNTDVKFAFYMHEGATYDGFRNFYVDNFDIHIAGPQFKTIDHSTKQQAFVDAQVREGDNNLFNVASVNETNISSIKVYDLSGRLIYRNDHVNSTTYQVQFNGISGNIYIFSIGMNNDTEKVVKKVLKK